MIAQILAAVVIMVSSVKMQPGMPISSISAPISPENRVLSASVYEEKELPKELYGSWKVLSITIETNNPEYLGNIGNDVWVFARQGSKVTLSNPKSGATASISVDNVDSVHQVSGKRAKFSRKKVSPNKVSTEIVEVIIEEENFSGTDTMVFQYIQDNRIYRTDVVKYKLSGKKISGAGLNEMMQ